jgi:ABC-2 type transport system ATP-binding protein
MIRIEHLNKKLKQKEILKDIDLAFEEGKIYLLRGHNGSGKTMLLRTLCGLLQPDKGSIHMTKKYTFGVIIENPSFNEGDSAWKNLKFLASVRNVIDDSKILKTLDLLNLAKHKNEKVKTFSLGMKQRLGICQAIMEDQTVLLLDEPFNALDEKSLRTVVDIFRSLRDSGKIVIIAAHGVDNETMKIVDEVVEMDNGYANSVVVG